MDRYLRCTKTQQAIITRLYEYLGFSEVTTFESFLNYFYYNAKGNIIFAHVLNKFLERLVTKMWVEFPEYKRGYITTFWVNENEALELLTVGNKREYDPKGVIRVFVLSFFNTKIKSETKV